MTDWMEAALAGMTLEEKLSLLSGANTWGTPAIDRLGVPSLWMSDGPHGARGTDDKHGPSSLSFAVGTAMGATFDPDLIEEVGRELAREARSKGVQVLLGPTVNIQRVPIAGRNFECFSEDPYLSGTMAAAFIRGLQGEGVAACVKHFVANDQETDRFFIDARVDERTLREIYLEPFRIAVAQAGPWSVMSSYNTINGTTASEHPYLDEVLREEFGFDGCVISDWYGTYSDGVVTGGLDLEMPGPGRHLSPETVSMAIRDGRVGQDAVDRRVRRLLTLIERTGARAHHGPLEARLRDWSQGAALIRRVGTESIVLLKNDGVLPLAAAPNIVVIGELAMRTPAGGGGSSQVAPHRVVSILDGIEAATGSRPEWLEGCSVWKGPAMLDIASMTHAGGARGFLVEYYDDENLSGSPFRTAVSERTFLSYFGSGDEHFDYDTFGLRVTGTFTARAAGRHLFSFWSSGRLKVYANGEMIVDSWSDSGPSPRPPDTSIWEVDLDADERVEFLIEFGAIPGERWRAIGMSCKEPRPEPSIEAAAAAARKADVAVVVAGLTHEYEAEGFDRPDLLLPGEQDALIAAVAAAQPNTVVVVTAGSAVEMPWYEDVAAVVHAWYGGQEAGHAVADVLFGKADPGGRLPLTFPMDSLQHPGLLNFPGDATTVRYGEGVYVGYRGFDRLGLQPRAAFGAGLSYTTFGMTDPSVHTAGDGLEVVATVTNTGDRAGSDVVRVFALGIGGVERRLAGFAKVRLSAGQSARVKIRVNPEQLRSWVAAAGAWSTPSGTVRFGVEGLFETAIVEGDLPGPGPYSGPGDSDDALGLAHIPTRSAHLELVSEFRPNTAPALGEPE